MEKIIKLKLNVPESKSYPVKLYRTKYQNNKALAVIGIDAEEPEPFADFSVNVPASRNLKANQFYFKTWSENEGFLEQFIEQGIVRQLSESVHTGFVSAPLVELLIDLPEMK